MTFPASPNTLADALISLRQSAASTKSSAQQARTTLAAGSVSANLILALRNNIISAISNWTSVASTTGLASYAQSQYSDSGLDIVTEYQNMKAAAQAVVDWITNNFPKDASGYLLKDQFSVSGLTVRQFTTAQTAGLVTALDNFIATIS